MNELLRQIERLLDVQRYRDAERLLERAFAEGRSDAALHCLAARVALSTDKVDEAERHLAQALSVDPRHYQARLLLHLCEREQERYADAERTIIELIRERPADAELLGLYADLMLRTLNLQKAHALAVEALRRDPECRRARLVELLLSVSEGNHAQASEQLRAIIAEDPDSLETLGTLYLVLVERRRYAEAFEVGRELLRLRPNDDELVASLTEVRAATHWSMLPLFPMRRYGWAGSVAVWLMASLTIRGLARSAPRASLALGVTFLIYVIYSWVYPPLLKRWLLHRGYR